MSSFSIFWRDCNALGGTNDFVSAYQTTADLEDVRGGVVNRRADLKHYGGAVKYAVVRERWREAPIHALRVDDGRRKPAIGKPLQWGTALFEWRQDG